MSSQDNVNDQRSEFTSSAVDTTAASTSAVDAQETLRKIISRETVIFNTNNPTASSEERGDNMNGMMGNIFKEAGIEPHPKMSTRLSTHPESIGRQHREGDGGARRTEEGEQPAYAWAQSNIWSEDGVARARVRMFDPSTRPVVVEEVEDGEVEEGKKNEGPSS
ncbi:hypothetical protein B9479_007599 [Cryptococcus floricola]|uniref:Uncharacterized protein n=1 Tax=Cryptococcus floricola TaxID=2591691 RepID=A0A5D3ALH6_9TREE|nr:hypothetical protein B9479_007599 [Cryptococcus floricola]